jgi:hypothetical protein
MALRIVRKFPGVTLDWLFLGIAAGYALTLRRLCAIIWNITAGCLTNTKQSIASIVSGDYLPTEEGCHAPITRHGTEIATPRRFWGLVLGLRTTLQEI